MRDLRVISCARAAFFWRSGPRITLRSQLRARARARCRGSTSTSRVPALRRAMLAIVSLARFWGALGDKPRGALRVRDPRSGLKIPSKGVGEMPRSLQVRGRIFAGFGRVFFYGFFRAPSQISPPYLPVPTPRSYISRSASPRRWRRVGVGQVYRTSTRDRAPKMPRTLNGAPASTRDAAPTPSTLLSKRAADASRLNQNALAACKTLGSFCSGSHP